MDQDPPNNQTPTNQDLKRQYQWFSPLRDIQPSIFNLDTTPYPEDNNIHEIDPELFAEGATHTSARTEISTNSGYRAQQCWSNPTKDNQPSIHDTEPAASLGNRPTIGIDPTPLTEEANCPSTSMGQPRHPGFHHQDAQTTTQPRTRPTTSTTNSKQPSITNSSNDNNRWPDYQGFKLHNTESNTASAYPNTKHRFNQPTIGQGPRMQTRHNTPSTGASPGCSNTNTEHYNPTEGIQQGREIPHPPQHGIRRSQTQSNISGSNNATPTVREG